MFVEQLRRAVEASPRASLQKSARFYGKRMRPGRCPRPRRRPCRKPSSLERPFRPRRSPYSGVSDRGLELPLLWNAAAAGPPQGLCRRRSRAGSRWPSKPSWPWSRPSTRSTGLARCPSAKSRPWPVSARPRCATPCGRRGGSGSCRSKSGGCRRGATCRTG